MLPARVSDIAALTGGPRRSWGHPREGGSGASSGHGGKRSHGAASRPAGPPLRRATALGDLGFPRISLLFLICIRILTRFLGGNSGPRRSWEVQGATRELVVMHNNPWQSLVVPSIP